MLWVAPFRDFSIFCDKIDKGAFGLDSNTVQYYSDSNLSTFKLKFRNGSEESLVWDKKAWHWGYHTFIGYLVDIDYLWFTESDHGDYDIFFNVKNGKKIYFLPTFSPNNTNFSYINSEWGYGDRYDLNMIFGNNVNSPLVKIDYTYYPYYGNDFNARMGMDNFHWINDSEFLFSFYHLQYYGDFGEREDTLFYDKLNVKIRLKSSR